jgi:hypothetical protein
LFVIGVSLRTLFLQEYALDLFLLLGLILALTLMILCLLVNLSQEQFYERLNMTILDARWGLQYKI